MKRLTYIHYEILRTVRNRRFLIFSLIFPLILFLAIAGENRHVIIDGIGFPLYFMTGMAAWGSMTAVVSVGGRIAQERSVGWTRQMRVTPLKTSTYFTAKVLTGYMTAVFSIVVLSLAGTSLGVRLDATQWLTMLGLLLIGLVPFVLIGIALGHLISVDSLGPALGGITSLFALLGGSFGPLAKSGVLFTIVKLLPSYWLVQAGKSALLGAHIWSGEAWIVLAVWSLAMLRLTVWVFRRDTLRV
jgi:ABC-2 type transport system permease protein